MSQDAGNASSGQDATSGPDASAGPDATLRPDASDASDGSEANGDAALPFLDLPFSYTITGGNVVIHSDGGDLTAGLAPWGAHFVPNTGHEFGDPKANLAAYFTTSPSALTNLDGGACNVGAGNSCQLPESAIAGKAPLYRAPLAGFVFEVAQDVTPGSIFYPSEVQIHVRVHAGPYDFLFGHMSGVTADIRQQVLQATCDAGACVDVDTWQFPTARVGSATGLNIPVAAGQPFGWPQTVAVSAPTPGYYQGAGVVFIPWVEMEYFVSIAGNTLCYFDLLQPSVKSALQAILNQDMADPSSPRYGKYAAEKWQWGAEGNLCTAYSTLPANFTSLYESLGGWWQLPSSDGGTADEVIAFVQIAESEPSYDAGLYTSPSVKVLMLRQKDKTTSGVYTFAIADGGTVQASRVNGEIQQDSGSAWLVRWRDLNAAGGTVDVFQRAAYALGSSGLMVRWGDGSTDPSQASVPVLGPTDTCASVGVACYNHQPTGTF